MTMEDLKARPRQRPPELNLLDGFVGRWEWEGEGTVVGLDRPVRFTGHRKSRWEGEGWYLVTRESGTMEGFGESRTLAIWSYDSWARCFRTAYVDSAGTTMTGTAWHDGGTTTWHCEAISHGPAGIASAKGHIRFPNPDTMEWDWTERDAEGLRETMALTGVCRRLP